MLHFNEVIEFSRKLSKALLKGKKPKGIQSLTFLNDREKEEVIHKLNDDSHWENYNRFMSDIDIDSQWDEMEKKISLGKVRKFGYLKYAAAIALAVSVGVVLNFFIETHNAEEELEIVAGSEKAILTLENGEDVELSKVVAYNSSQAHLVDDQLQYKSFGRASISYNYLTIPRGGQFSLRLSDGTQVWLNSETKLKYPVEFVSGQTRKVELIYGEAYFDVSHSTDHNGDAFQVVAQGQNVQVLGTEFNIRAYAEEENIYTTLSKGSIAIHTPKQKNVLQPGEQAITHKTDANMTIHQVDVDYEAAWKNGLFMFEKESLADMMNELARWYDAEIVFENPEKKDYHFSGLLHREENIAKLLNTLEKTKEVEFQIVDKKIIIK
ncbi:FecR family protein [Fulvivirga ligni]|uniref:FecR family protein n=1 Tax=Fulvivirga ligni TaxID=2904246 RepID=UPI001F1D9BCA|nr:FecR domain-containing protein [Fulvivirga ligni]UII19006.1 DUF4974 domain-containing protein [Fulvivirga ligni]